MNHKVNTKIFAFRKLLSIHIRLPKNTTPIRSPIHKITLKLVCASCLNMLVPRRNCCVPMHSLIQSMGHQKHILELRNFESDLAYALLSCLLPKSYEALHRDKVIK